MSGGKLRCGALVHITQGLYVFVQRCEEEVDYSYEIGRVLEV